MFDKVFMFVYTGAEFDYYLNFIFMENFNYLKMLPKACMGKLNDLEVDYLCQQYCRNEANWAGSMLSLQLKKMPDVKVADFLKVYGNKLWSLYFKSVGAKPYGLEVQKMLIYSASMDDFMLLPHNLTISGELLLVEMQKMQEAPDDCFALSKLEWYLQQYELSFEALLKLIEQSEKIHQVDAAEKHQLHLLGFALQKLAECAKPNALSSVETQLRILGFADDEYIIKSMLHFFDMQNVPDEKIVRKLVEIGNIDYLKELLSHSCVGKQKELVFKAFPKLKAELLLSEIGYAACRINYKEALYYLSKNYQRLTMGYRSYFSVYSRTYNCDTMPILLVCFGMYINAHTQEMRCEWIERALDYCRRYQKIPELKSVIPLLQKLLIEEKQKAA